MCYVRWPYEKVTCVQQPSEDRRTRAPNTYALSSERSFLCLVVCNLAVRYRVYWTNFNFKRKFISVGSHFLISLFFRNILGSWAKLTTVWKYSNSITAFQWLAFQSWFTNFWQQTCINKFLQLAAPFKWLLDSIHRYKELDKQHKLKMIKTWTLQ